MVSGLEVSATQDIIVPAFFPFIEDTEETGLSPILPLDQKGQTLPDDTINGIKMKLLFSIYKISSSSWIIVNQNSTTSTQIPSKELQLSIVYIKGLEFLNRGLVITGASTVLLFVTSIKGNMPFVNGIPATAAMLSIFLAFVIERMRLVNR